GVETGNQEAGRRPTDVLDAEGPHTLPRKTLRVVRDVRTGTMRARERNSLLSRAFGLLDEKNRGRAIAVTGRGGRCGVHFGGKATPAFRTEHPSRKESS